MARTDLTVYTTVVSGRQLTAIEASGTADGKQFVNSGDQILYLRNSNAAATRDVTISTTNKTAGGASYTTSEVVTLPTSGIAVMGPFTPAVWNKSSNVVYVDFESTESDVKIVCLSFARAR